MKIIQLTAENIKKLTAVEIKPDGNVVQITGKNGQGKTSVLDAIWWALSGTENVQSQPIRKGSDSARIELQLGSGETVELIVERKFTEKASYLNVKTADGAKYPSPQKMLDDLLGALTFDPLQFMRAGAKGQFEVLKGLVELSVDPEEIDRANKEDYAKRTDVNREAKAKRAQADSISVPDGLPEQAVDETALLDEIQKGADTNAQIEQRKARRQEAEATIAQLRHDAETHRRRAEEILQQAKDAEDRALETEQKLKSAPKLPDPVDIGALRASLDEAKRTNEGIRLRDRRNELSSEANLLEEKSAAITKAMESREKKKLAAIAEAKMPVEGLSFGDGVVTFKDLPLDQASDAEQLMISSAIAAALNPKLRVIRIRDGSLLDEDAMQRLATFADERDFQIWIERVDGSGKVGIVMEDGHVRGAEPKEEKAKKAKSPATNKEAAE